VLLCSVKSNEKLEETKMTKENKNIDELQEFVKNEVEQLKDKIVSKCKEIGKNCSTVDLDYNIETEKKS
jgi:hypothetical protein